MLNKINNLNENGSQLELIAKKGKNNMTNKTKRIKIKHMSWILDFVQSRKELGEEVVSITYKEGKRFSDEKFTFKKHTNLIELTPWDDNITSFETDSKGEFENEEVDVRKVYKYDEETNDFVIHSKRIYC